MKIDTGSASVTIEEILRLISKYKMHKKIPKSTISSSRTKINPNTGTLFENTSKKLYPSNKEGNKNELAISPNNTAFKIKLCIF